MEKVNQSISKEYLPVKIYADDIENIVSVFEESKVKYSLRTERYRYDSLSELLENSAKEKDLKALDINTINPDIHIEFHKMWAKIYVASDEPFVTGLFHKIDRIIDGSKRGFSFAYSYYFVWILNILVPLIGALNQDGKFFPEYIEITFITIWLIWVARVLYIRLVRHSVIQLIRKDNVSNFFQRKRDELILVLISTLIGAIPGVLGTVLVTKYM